jgi:hypothetical protein
MKTRLEVLRLGEVKPNPYRDIENYKLDPDKIASLRASIGNTGFWPGVLVREANGGFELLFGHHRIEAARQELGDDYEHQFIVREDVPDHVALKMLADENADSWAMGLLYDTLVRSLARQRPLIPRYRRSGHSLVVATPRDGDDPDRTQRQQQTLSRLHDAYGASLFGTVPNLGFPFQEGVHLKLEQVDGKWWCGFEPYTFVQLPRQESSQTDSAEGLVAEEAPAEMVVRAERRGDPAGDWRRERWAPRYNRNWASIIGAWAQLLTETGGTTRSAFGLEEGTGIDAVFKVSPVTGFSRPSHHHTYFDRSK